MLTIHIEHDDHPNNTYLQKRFGKFKEIPLIHVVPPGTNSSIKGHIKVNLKEKETLENVTVQIDIVGLVQSSTTSQNDTSWAFFHKEMTLNKTFSVLENSIPFEELLHPTFNSVCGSLFQARYYVQAKLSKLTSQIAEAEADFAVSHPFMFGPVQNYFGEFGVPDTLHVKVEFNKTAYYVDDNLIGKITICVSKVPLKSLEFHIIKVESNTVKTVHDLVYHKEIKTGGLKVDDMIPINVNLSSLCLEPTTFIKLVKMGIPIGDFSISYLLKIVVFPKEGASFFRKFPFVFKQK